jgi:hypothetical protein
MRRIVPILSIAETDFLYAKSMVQYSEDLTGRVSPLHDASVYDKRDHEAIHKIPFLYPNRCISLRQMFLL